MTYEYKTTHGELARYWTDPEYGRQLDEEPDDPIPPDGDGWELVTMGASGARLYWAWRRKARATR